MADLIGATGTPRQRLTAVLLWIVAQLVLAAKRRTRDVKAQEAIAEEAGLELGG